RKPQAKAHPRLRQQGEVEVAHAPHRIKKMGRVLCLNRRSRGRWIQGIRQQVEVGETLIAAETALEVVPLALIGPQPQGVVRVASPAKAVEVKIVEQEALVSLRLHRKRLVEETRTLLQIDQSVVHVGTAAYVGRPVAELTRGVNEITAARNAIGFPGRILCRAGRLSHEKSWRRNQ